MQKAVAQGSGTGKAIEHALKRWPALLRYADSGTFPIDNNAIENAIRPVAIGEKNWLFAGSERAGRRAAAAAQNQGLQSTKIEARDRVTPSYQIGPVRIQLSDRLVQNNDI